MALMRDRTERTSASASMGYAQEMHWSGRFGVVMFSAKVCLDGDE